MNNLFNRGLFSCIYLIIPLLTIFIEPFFSFISADEQKKFELQILLTKKQSFEIAFPEADSIKKEKRWLTKEETHAIGELSRQSIKEMRFTFYSGIKNSKPMGYMLIDNIVGKSFPITFMTVLNIDGTVRDVEIMVYREPQGWEVKYKSFRQQFYGKNSSSDPREINSISGATLSVNAIKMGVYKALAAYKVLYLDK